jgi:hypothetical protein
VATVTAGSAVAISVAVAIADARDRLPAWPCRADALATVLRASLMAFWLRPLPDAPPWPNDRQWAAPESCRQLGPGVDRSPSGRRLPVGTRKPAPRLSTTGSTTSASSTATGRRRDRLLVPDCDRELNSHRARSDAPRTASSASDRGAREGPRKALAIDRKAFRPDLSVALALAKAGFIAL